MFEKLLDTFERIATALERIAAYAGNPNVKVANQTAAADPALPPATASKPATATKPKPAAAKPAETAPKKDVAAVPQTDDGLGETVTFETMRNKLVTVKHNEKLGPAKSSAILAKFGKLNEIKEDKFAEVVAACDALLVSVGA
jgi:predicted phage gp36 major capsid-like protein